MGKFVSFFVACAVVFAAFHAMAAEPQAPANPKVEKKSSAGTAETLLKENRDGTYSMSEELNGKLFTFITADDLDEAKIKTAFKDGFKELTRILDLTSHKSAKGSFAKINANAGIKPVVVPPELFDIISRAIEVSTITKGAFDITYGPLGKLWDFKKVPFVVPTEVQIKEALPLVDYSAVELDKSRTTVFLKQPGMSIGLGGIATGYAADKVTYILQNHGLRNFVVYAGGDLMVIGRKGEKSWKVGIQDPFHPENYFATMPVINKAVVTSGDYEKAYDVDGKFYHHIIDTKTGYPSIECHQVTIVADYATYADALATGVFVLGPNVSIPLIEKMPGVDALIIDMQGNVYMTSGIKDSVKIKKEYTPPTDSADAKSPEVFE